MRTVRHMFDTDDIPSNPSGNPSLTDLIDQQVSRRTILKGAAAASMLGFLGSTTLSPGVAEAARRPLLGFSEVPPSTDDTIHVPAGYTWDVLVPWGTPLFAGVTWADDASNTAADQAKQVGFNHDGMWFFALPNRDGRQRGLLCINHEYTDASQIYTAAQGSTITADAAGEEKVAKALAAHGVTVVEVRQQADGSWSHVVGSRFNRRITGTTPMAFSGPVTADNPALASGITPAPLGTLNNCANGYTPWGTYLTCEENWNGYFGTANGAWTATALESRYGVSKTGFGYSWHIASSRFDLDVNRNEVNHFGWVVEIDPKRPGSTPVKRSALGRIKHEGATTITAATGEAVVYMGDDENGEYLYKFVGDRPWAEYVAEGESPLDHGTLYVAKFDALGGGQWLALVHGEAPFTVGGGWADQADVLIRTRQAADAVGATKLHRPEWTAVHPKSGDVFVTLTNGSGNSAPVNSDRSTNPYGHIVRIHENDRDHTTTTFTWDLYAIAGDSAYDGTVEADQPIFGSPDGLWCDPDGRLWIQTDISNSSQNLVAKGYDRIGNNQMLVGHPRTGQIRRFLTGPRGCEVTGITMTPDQRTMFVNIQHPGESTTYWNNLYGAPSTTNPTTVSTWPSGGRPRSATVVIRRTDGGVIGA